MRTTISIEDELFEQAAKRLATLGGESPEMEETPRRKG